MRQFARIVGWGFLVWLLPFVVGFFVFPFRESWRALFESVMAVAVTLAAALFGFLYLRKLPAVTTRQGLLVGAAWWLIAVAIDLPLFSAGPMKMSLADYLADIGLTYVSIPVVTVALAAAASKKSPG